MLKKNTFPSAIKYEILELLGYCHANLEVYLFEFLVCVSLCVHLCKNSIYEISFNSL